MSTTFSDAAGGLTVTPAAILYQLQHEKDNRSAVVTVTTSVFMIAATTAVLLRLISRRIVGLHWRADDYAVVVALV